MKAPSISQSETGVDYQIDIYTDYVNERIRLDDYRGNVCSIIKKIAQLTKQYNFSKTIVKSRFEDFATFLENGYCFEGKIGGYFNGSDLYFLVYYATDLRRTSNTWKKEDEFLKSISQLPIISEPTQLPENYSIRLATNDDCQKLAELYKEVFESYPTPMNDEAYIRKVIEEGTIFNVVEFKGKIVSAASAEINRTYHNAEMTDCATLNEHRKYGLMQLLLLKLEDELVNRQMYCSYSLARAGSFGMNACFKKLGYTYSGRLTNNCIMNENFENMNVWVKKLV